MAVFLQPVGSYPPPWQRNVSQVEVTRHPVPPFLVSVSFSSTFFFFCFSFFSLLFSLFLN
jgi:hypothetical protein